MNQPFSEKVGENVQIFAIPPSPLGSKGMMGTRRFELLSDAPEAPMLGQATLRPRATKKKPLLIVYAGYMPHLQWDGSYTFEYKEKAREPLK